MIEPLYALAGALVGLLVGMTGVGGGSLMTPILVLLFNFHPATAVGTDLLFASATKSAGTAVHGWRGTVDWRIVALLGAGSIPAAVVTLVLLSRMGNLSAEAASLITAILGGMLVLTGISLLLRKQIVSWATVHIPDLSAAAVTWLTVLLGLILGIAVSLTSIGAGAIGVTVLLILYPERPLSRIAGTDIAHAVPLTLIGGVGHWLIGSVDLALLGSLLVGSIPGVVVGSFASTRIPDHRLRMILACTLVIVGMKILV